MCLKAVDDVVDDVVEDDFVKDDFVKDDDVSSGFGLPFIRACLASAD